MHEFVDIHLERVIVYDGFLMEHGENTNSCAKEIRQSDPSDRCTQDF